MNPTPPPAAVAGMVGAGEVSAVAIAEAKRLWWKACSDGSSAARVQRLYEAYRDLVIRQAAAAVRGPSAHAS